MLRFFRALEYSENLQQPERWDRLHLGPLKSENHSKQAILNMNLNARGPGGKELEMGK